MKARNIFMITAQVLPLSCMVRMLLCPGLGVLCRAQDVIRAGTY